MRLPMALNFASRGCAAALLVLLCVPPVHAQITEEPVAPLPDPKKFAHGVFVDAGLGAFVLLGKADAVGSGPAISGRVGYDLFRLLAVQLHVAGSTHRTDFGAAPQSGQLLQVYQTTAELKLTVPIRQVSVYAFGGAGFAFFSTNILGTTGLTTKDKTSSLVYGGGLGLDYHLLSRHFSFGLEASFAKIQEVQTTGGILSTAYVRYAF
ncbi:MAG: outer membrane beta-barrel protein [Deltaproteobacteria bacterium]|nr:outer membrane beta-barrel protein [Deltaproteobacteria bacterium]